MKYIFFGTPEFAAIILKKLIDAGLVPQAVVCNPDRPVGRKKVITPPPVKTSILQQIASIRDKIQILQPDTKEDLFHARYQLLATQPDFAVVAAYGKILPKEILEIPRLGTIGVHPSLLPKYRGSSPIQAAILNGEKKTGITLYLLDEKTDHGPILAQRELTITNDDDYNSLSRKLAELGAELLIKLLPDFTQGKITSMAQNEKEATYTKKFKTEDAYVDWGALRVAENKGGEFALQIERKIRALNPEPGVFTVNPPADEGKRIKLLEAQIIDGKLKIIKIQVEGGKPQTMQQ